MAHRYTEEQLNTADKSLLIQIIMNLQDQTESLTKEVHELNNKMQLMLEQLVLAKKDRFGRSSEKNGGCCPDPFHGSRRKHRILQ